MNRPPLSLLHHCSRFAVVDKPAGMIVHRSGWCEDGEPVLQLLRDQLGQHVYPVHRLDRGTSGVLVFALDPEAARHLGEQFAAHTVDKRYLAVVRGWPTERGVVDSPLVDPSTAGRDPPVPPQSAVTEFWRRGTVELPIAVGRYATARYALMEARPRTGRTHQIRRHFGHLRHPIVGDVCYGDGRHNRMWREVLGRPGLMLRAVSIGFIDLDGNAVQVTAPLEMVLPVAE